MKADLVLPLLLACLGLLLAGCGSTQKAPKLREPMQLSDSSVRLELDCLMGNAGISDKERALFFKSIDAIEDPIEPQMREFRPDWEQLPEEEESFSGRVMAFSLLRGNFLEVPRDGACIWDGYLKEDLSYLREKGWDTCGFRGFYSGIPVAEDTDNRRLQKLWLESWENRKIGFYENPRVRLITVLEKVQTDAGYFGQAVEAGLLFETQDKTLWYLRKEYPTKLPEILEFSDRGQLKEFLRQGREAVILENREALTP